MKHLQLQRNKYIKKLVSNARAILTNEIALSYGILKMDRIINWINNIEPIDHIDFQIFKEYNLRTGKFSVGPERSFYNLEFLKAQDKELDKITLVYKDKIFDKCFEIIQTFDK